MNFEEWLKSVSPEITDDPLWKMAIYRQALFLGDLALFDVCILVQDRRTMRLSDQLYRSAGSISANISEGYSRASRKDQARFYEFALSSARETRDWYYKGRHLLGDEIVTHRIQLIVHIIRQLMKMIPNYRRRSTYEERIGYKAISIESLLRDVPGITD